MPSTFAALADQRRVAMQEGDTDTHLAQPAQHSVSLKNNALIFPSVITKAAVFQL